MKLERQRGIGFLAMVVIVAIIALGGTAVVKANKNKAIQAEIEEQAKLDAEVNAQVQEKLVELKTVVTSDIAADVKLESVQKIVASINTLIDEAFEKGKASVKKGVSGGSSNLIALKARIAELEAQLNSDVEVAINIIDGIIADLGSKEEMTKDEQENDSAIEEDKESMIDGSADAEVDGSVDTNNNGASIEAGVNVNGGVEIGL